MIIKSSFKDYYDYVEHINGGDPKIIYLRNRLNPLELAQVSHIHKNIRLQTLLRRQLPTNHCRSYNYHTFKWCIVAGKYYLIAQHCPINESCGKWFLVLPESELMLLLCPRDGRRNWATRNYTIDYFFGTSDESSIQLCRTLHQPVFLCINDWEYIDARPRKKQVDYVVIDCELPILRDLGFTSVYSAEILYQDIAYFMSNTIYDNPDIKPPVEISNDCKIEGHGFDMKQSFRHRRA